MSRQGTYTNNLSGISLYQSFCPSFLPLIPEIELKNELLKLLIEAYQALSRLDGISSKIPNKDIFVAMYIRKEALLSSQIEGTQATLDDIFEPHNENNMNQEVSDVLNYVKALNYANERIKDLPISNRLIKEIHQILLTGVRGKDKEPGEFRRTQNWIGPQNSTIKNAVFIPPNIETLKESMSNLEKFIHYDESTDILIKIALVHYQFETIHPFLDGNGRIGRLMINLLLKQNMIVSDDILYISYYLKRNRSEYYDRLMAVRNKGHYEEWITFFLKGMIVSAKDSIETIDSLVHLHNLNIEKIEKSVGRAKNTVMKIFNLIETTPIIDIRSTSQKLDVTFKTISHAIDILISLGILEEVSSKLRYRVFAYTSYLNILRKGTEIK